MFFFLNTYIVWDQKYLGESGVLCQFRQIIIIDHSINYFTLIVCEQNY